MALTPTAGLTVTQDQALPTPTKTDLAVPGRPTVVGPYDTVTIDVFGVPELSKEVQADASARISFPLVGTIDAGGKSPEELAGIIEAGLKNYVRNPQVIVNVKQTVSQVITVDGDVEQPGLYPVVGRMTLMRAIASAKGASEFAKLDDVVVLRTVDNQRMAGLYNLTAIRRGAYADPEVFANDVIIVGDSPTRRLISRLVSISPILSAPIIAVLQRR